MLPRARFRSRLEDSLVLFQVARLARRLAAPRATMRRERDGLRQSATVRLLDRDLLRGAILRHGCLSASAWVEGCSWA